MNLEYFSILGKYGSETGLNLLIYHLIDTAAVSSELWEITCPQLTKSQIKDYFCCLLNRTEINDEEFKNYLRFFSALHDLGKISPNFQKNIWNSNILEPKSTLFNFYKNIFQKQIKRIGSYEKIHHSALTYQAIQELRSLNLSNLLLDFQSINLNEIGLVLSAHHGFFHKSEILLKIRRNKENQLGDTKWDEIRKSYIEALAYLFFSIDDNESEKASSAHAPKSRIQDAIWLAGFICISDWIASNEKFFPYSDILPEDYSDLQDYWKKAQKRAKNVINELNWSIKNTRIRKEHISFKRIFNKEPRPLQQKIDIIRMNQPECVIIEAPTGEGKTEAAMYAMIKNDLLGLSGAYFALPTQATSNQMFNRVKEFLGNYYINPDEKFNLMLLHGHATLVDDFKKIIEFSSSNIIDNEEYPSAIPWINQWFTYRKRGLLNPYGVGTIDQALMSILQTKHYFVRLNGLTGKTIILDEIHAYDAFMSELIEKLLTWLAALGSSVILLSATLPSVKRFKLITAFQKGKELLLKNGNNNDFTLVLPYPRITWTSGHHIKEAVFQPSSVGKKKVKISWIIRDKVNNYDRNPYKDRIIKGKVYQESLKAFFREKLRNGGCGAVICNRVDESQEIYRSLQNLETNEGFELLLFHSRYRICERNDIENKVIKYFGENRKFRPKKAIVIATQVIEQSLDIDFDIMVSAIAPIDLILQRIGRLHRHRETDSLRPIKEPELVIMIPSSNSELQSLDVPHFKIYSRIYQPHILLRSWLYLKDIEEFKLPEMTEDAIEFVYNENLEIPTQYKSDSELGTYWRNTWEKLQNKREKISKMAINQIIRDPDGVVPFYKISESHLQEDDPTVHEFQRAQTRLMRPSLSIIFLKRDEKSYYEQKLQEIRTSPTRFFSKEFKKWLLERIINVANYPVIKAMDYTNVPTEWENDNHLRYNKLIVLDNSSKKDLGNGFILELDDKLGLLIKKNREGV